MNDYISRMVVLNEAEHTRMYDERDHKTMVAMLRSCPAAAVRPVRPCDGCPFCVCEKHGVICPSDPDFRCDTRGGTP